MPRLVELTKTFELPDYVKSADAEDTIDAINQEHPLHQCADPVAGLYPCFDRCSTVLAAASYYMDRSRYSKQRQEIVEANLKKFASLFKVTDDVAAIEKQANATPVEEVDMALEVEYEGKKLRAFPIRNKKEACIAAQYLLDNWPDLPYSQRRTAARNILKIADARNYELGSYRSLMERIAGEALFYPAGIKQLVETFQVQVDPLIPKEVKNENYSQIAAQIKEASAAPQALLEDEVVDLLDSISCLAVAAGNRRLEPPEFLVYPVSKSELKEFKDQAVFTKAGSLYHEHDFRRITSSILSEYFTADELGFDPAEVSVYKLKKFASTASEPLARRLDYLMRELGVSPRQKDRRGWEIPVD